MVEWEDSAQPIAAWKHLADLEAPSIIKCVSVGWLVSDTKNTKALAPNMGAVDDATNLQISGMITIPARAITKITRLQEPRLS